MANEIICPSESNQVAGSDTLEFNNEGKALTVNNNQETAFEDEEKHPQFSVFTPGYVNHNKGIAVLQTSPHKITDLVGVYKFIIGDWAKETTCQLRAIVDKDKAAEFKKLNFWVATISGIFRYRRATELVEHSQLMVFDFDEEEIMEAFPGTDITEAIRQLKEMLLDDTVFETELLFISPSGNGLKWVIYVGDMQGMKHRDYFRCVSKYIYDTYNVRVDESGKDVCRACFLPHDPDCYINPSLLKVNERTKN